MPDSTTHSVLGVFLTGFRPSLTDLCDALARQPRIDFVGAARHVDEAERSLSVGDVDIVIHAIVGRVPRDELAAIREHTSAPIVLLVDDPDPGLFDEALSADVADVVVLPERAERVAFTVQKAVRATARAAAEGRPRARVITVFSPKGGTGKTVVSSNLAASLAKYEGQQTLLLDLDLQFGDAAIMLGIQPEKTLHDLITAAGELDGDKFRGYLTRHAASGVDVLAAPLRPEDGEHVTDDDIERLLDVARLNYEVIVVDTSPFFHGPMLMTLDRTDDLLVVCSPEVPALKNVRLGIETLRLLNFPDERMRLCLNRADRSCGVQRPEVEGALGLDVHYELPSDPDVPAAVNRGVPLVLSSESGEFALAVGEMSRSLLGVPVSAPAPAGVNGQRSLRSGLLSTVGGLTSDWLPSRAEKKAADAAERSA